MVNHALLLADLQSGRRLLPPYRHLIIDEAHRLEGAATEQLTYRVDMAAISVLSQGLLLDESRLHAHPPIYQLAQQLHSQIRHLLPAMQTFVDSLLRVVRRQPEVEEALGQPQRVDLAHLRPQPRWSQVEVEWESISASLRRVARTLADLENLVSEARRERAEIDTDLLAHLQQGRAAIEEVDSHLEALICQPNRARAESVSWLDLNAEASAVTFCVAPVQVSHLLEKELIRPCRTLILTGATLRTDEGFEFMQERLGCWDSLVTAIESPFDYRANVLLYLPSDLPTPDRPGYQTVLEKGIMEAALAAQGRTMVLFTSHAHLRATAEAIRAPLDQLGIAVLEHGLSSRGRLLPRISQRAAVGAHGHRHFLGRGRSTRRNALVPGYCAPAFCCAHGSIGDGPQRGL